MYKTRVDIFVFQILLTELCLQQGVVEEEAGAGVVAGQKGARVETEEQRQAREARELVEQKQHELIEFMKQHPCLYDIAHQEHLNNVVTWVLWEEIAEKLGVNGKNFIYNNMWKYIRFAINKYT